MNDLAPLMSSARTGDNQKDEWRTPAWLFEKLDSEFHFTLDPAATKENSLCDWFLDKEADGLKCHWFGSVYVNPPYSQLKVWVKKGFEQVRDSQKVNRVVMLVAARTDTKAWWDYIRFGEVRFLPGRLKFDSADGVARFSAPFPSAVVIFDRKRFKSPSTFYWNVRESNHAV